MPRLKASKIINAINRGIAVNPTNFIVKKVTKNIVDGAFEDVEENISYTGIIYLEDTNVAIKTDSKTIGTEYSTTRYKMILNNENKITVDEQNKVEFDCNEGHMKIQAVYPIFIENTLCGYMCDLERI